MNGDEVNEAKLLEKINSFEGEWKDTAAAMLKECKGKMQEIKARMAEKGPMREDCNPSAAILSVCIGKQTLEKCPANKWNDCKSSLSVIFRFRVNIYSGFSRIM